MLHLTTGMEEKKHYETKQGAMFAFETLSSSLGRLFEPYITIALPMLLTSFGNSSSDASHDTMTATCSAWLQHQTPIVK